MKQLKRNPIFALLAAVCGAIWVLIALNTALVRAQPVVHLAPSAVRDATTACGSPNIALDKVATASSCQNSGCLPGLAIDGNGGTRWASEFTDTAWISVDLGSAATIECVVLKWETAYGKQYQIQVSDNALGWTPVFTETNGDGETDAITLTTPISSHYVRMLGTQRGNTAFGYSLYEFEIHGSGGIDPIPTLTPTPIPGKNIALNKPAYASYYQDASKAPKYVVDGKRDGGAADNRWASMWNKHAWLFIDLGKPTAIITNVALFWEDAYAVDFNIQTSNDAVQWTDVFTRTGNSFDSCEVPKVNVITFSPPVSGRYVRMLGLQRRSFGGYQYGYSLYEFEVYGSGDDPNVTPTPTPTPPPGTPTLAWSDEFNGTGNINANGLNVDNWTFETDVCVNNEQQKYTTDTSNVRVVSGTLILEAHDTLTTSQTCPGCNGNRFTSGRIITKDKREFKYGRFEARIKLPAGAGLWPAFWLLGNDIDNTDEVGWPQCGETDIFENIGYEHWVSGGIHGPGYYGAGNVGAIYSDTNWLVTDWHTYAVEWDPIEIKGYVDNTVFYTITRATLEAERGQWVFDHPFFIILNLALGGEYPYGYNHQDPGNDACYGLPKPTIDSLPQRMEVDWVRVYQRVGPDAPITGVMISGPTTGPVNKTYTFTASINPVTATTPITYTWTPAPNSGQGTANATYAWASPGDKTITVTAQNLDSTVADTHTISVVAPSWMVYLPIVVKCWPLIPPSAPTLNPIDNSDGNGDYIVSWSYGLSCPSVVSYTLQEAADLSFTTDLVTYYPGDNPSQVISWRGRGRYGRSLGTHYYRVQGHNAAGAGGWSNLGAVAVTVFCTNIEPGHTEGYTETITALPTLVSRIYISMTERTLPDYGFSLWEVEAYGPNTGNLMCGGAACASSVEADRPEYYGPLFATDCNPNTRWSSKFYQPQWFEAVLPKPEVLNRIVLRWERAYAKTYCVILKPDAGVCGS